MKYRISSDDIVSEDFDGETVVLDLGTGRYFGLNATASALWSPLSSGVDRAVLQAMGVAKGWIDSFAANCQQAGLLVTAPEAAEFGVPRGFAHSDRRPTTTRGA